jgi:polyketide synthase PksN
MRALTQAFRAKTDKRNYCAIGSVKTNIGHCAGAAGIAGLLKVLLAFKHRQIPASLNYERGNSAIDFDSSPFYVNTQLRDWSVPQGETRKAAVSSFGFSGTNAHIVLEEPPARLHTPQFAPARLIALSARTAAQLRQQAELLVAHCMREETAECGDISFTLLTGRRHFKHRLACVVRDGDELISLLQRWLAGRPSSRIFASSAASEPAPDGDISRSRAERCVRTCGGAANPGEYSRCLAELAELFVRGCVPEFEKLFERGHRRVALPTYPFSREVFWGSATSSAGNAPALVLHPLLHRNTSDLEGTRYSTRLEGEEFYLRDHVVSGRRVLPAVAHLEMARAAVEAAGAAQTGGLRLKDVVWLRALEVSQPLEVHVGVQGSAAEGVRYEIYSHDAAGERVVHSQGECEHGPLSQEWLDIAGLRQRCTGHRTAQECYASFEQMGVRYGASHRALQAVWSGEQDGTVFALGEVKLPKELSGSLSQYVLHPSVLDSALQAAVGLLQGQGSGTARAVLPFSLQQLQVQGRSSEQAWVYVRESEHSSARLRQLDVQVSDAEGRVWASLKGLGLREQPSEQPSSVPLSSARSPWSPPDSRLPPADTGSSKAVMLVPVWEPAGVQAVPQSELPEESVLVIGGTAKEQAALRQRYPRAQITGIREQEWQPALRQGVDQVIWLCPKARSVSVESESLIEDQHSGVMVGFALVKALVQAGYDSRELGLTVVTQQSQSVRRGEWIDPTHASVHGFVGSVAKEYGHWKVRLVDVSAEEEVPWEQVEGLAADGESWGYRGGEWYRQELIPCETSEVKEPGYRRGGVYVVIGGAGGIGEAFSEHLIRGYDAQVVWIGRRALDEGIRAKQRRLGSVGREPRYIQADARDRHALQGAYEQVRAEYAEVNGLVHAAIVLRDRSVMKMTAEEFGEALQTKVSVSVRMMQVFGGERLDFVLFFSSLQSVGRMPGQSNYAAGCTFKDAHAQQLARTLPCAVKVMNWGYWGSLGIVASDFYRDRMNQRQMASIEAHDGMAALDFLMGSPFQQLGYVHVQEMVENRLRLASRMSLSEADAPSMIDSMDAIEEAAL